MANLNVRVDDLLKKQAEAVLDELGLSLSASITVFLKRVVRCNGIPFELRIGPVDSAEDSDRLPDAITLREEAGGAAYEEENRVDEPNQT